MSSSTSNSEHWRFLGWVLAALVASGLVVNAIPWGGVPGMQRGHERIGKELGPRTDFLIVGDSKAGPFSVNCLSPWLPGKRGLTFSADSVTPVFHYDTLREIHEAEPGFAPPVVFVFLGANNLNANGLHVERDYTFFNELGLADAWALSAPQGEVLSFAAALLSRLFPVYGKRVMITHLQFRELKNSCEGASDPEFDRARWAPSPPARRKPVLDRNYLDIYRRSMYADYRSSPIVVAATGRVLEGVQQWGGVPVIVLPPVTPEMRALEHELIGEAFDDTVNQLAREHGVAVLDLRERADYDFADVNHLTPAAARLASEEHLYPRVVETLAKRASPGS